jgi:hypothetical protein
MIKIEKISATKATIVRGGLRQPLILNSHVSAEELATVEAETGSIIYSVDEKEVKELTFQPKPAAPAPKPAISQPPPRVRKAAEPSVEPASTKAAAE